ncbi:Ig-like domain-containing protein [Clostridium beijerinckii]|uniref:BIG2 domain-containing protein n=1 Tax=Clostridium beijerinckii TaxID=1520 RepID=A0A7X9SLZ4_CLOBE|nr:Ig-like domain-containing protein [Clostridium beijerinckii]NMF04345.1 hypothetical protein [Clostridium beijerinckii]
MYNPIDSVYKKAIELEGIIANVGNTETKVLIREANNSTYGIDYKKIISSTSINQGNYVEINGVEFLIVDTEEQFSQTVYNIGIFRKTLPILLGDNYKEVQAIVDRDKITLVDGTYLQEVHDQYTFIIPKSGNSVSINNTLVYDLGIYTVISVDSSREGLLYVTGKYNTVYVPHTYTISLSESTKTLVQGETYQIVATCSDNGTVVENPTIIYASSDPNIVSVDATGLVNCLSVGGATITCTYNNVSAILQLVVEEKPVETVISYVENWSQTTTIKQYVTSTYTVYYFDSDGVTKIYPPVDYIFDSAGQSLGSKIVVTRKTDNSFSVKNATVTTVTTCNVSITDRNTGKVISTTLLTFKGM